MNEVSVSTLPHPISTFFIGFLLFGGIIIYFEFRKMSTEINILRNTLNDLKTTLKENDVKLENKIAEISKKIDSRVDKAMINLHRKNN
jgi:hypothetical protein